MLFDVLTDFKDCYWLKNIPLAELVNGGLASFMCEIAEIVLLL